MTASASTLQPAGTRARIQVRPSRPAQGRPFPADHASHDPAADLLPGLVHVPLAERPRQAPARPAPARGGGFALLALAQAGFTGVLPWACLGPSRAGCFNRFNRFGQQSRSPGDPASSADSWHL